MHLTKNFVYGFLIVTLLTGIIVGCSNDDPLSPGNGNNTPVAVDDEYSFTENGTIEISAVDGILSNDSDADGDDLSAVRVSDPSNGVLTFNSDGSFDYIPSTDFSGTDSFTYKVNDGEDDSNIGTVTITYEEPAPFSMQVIPENIGDSSGQETIPGQRCVFLVSITEEGEENKEGNAVTISASTPGAAVTVEPETITSGQVAEVTVIPDEASIDKTLPVTIHGERDGLKQTETGTVKVVKFSFDPGHLTSLARMAEDIRDKFIPWLAANHPELGITSEIEWTGIMIRPEHFITRFYLFFSEDWEMGMTWHTTTPPHDWTHIYLRHRFTETRPSYGFEISSWSTEGEEPHAIDPQDPLYFMSDIWR